MTAILNQGISEVFALEPGNWLALLRDVPELGNLSGAELLTRTQQELPRHFRYARTQSGVVLLGEDQAEDSENGLFLAEERLRSWLKESPEGCGDFPDEQVIETALADLAATRPTLDWSRREARLVVPVGAFSPLEIEIRPGPAGVRVETLLTILENPPEAVCAALGEFLARVQVGLRFARAEFDGLNVRIASQASMVNLDVELALALAGVAAGCQRFCREAAALARPELAEVYLQSVI